MPDAGIEMNDQNILPAFIPKLETQQISLDLCSHIFQWLVRMELEWRIPTCGKALVTIDFDTSNNLCIALCRLCGPSKSKHTKLIWILVPTSLFLKFSDLPMKTFKGYKFVILPQPLGIYELDRTGNQLVANRLYRHVLQQEAMAWLSTLGGGFSCLGDRFEDAAEIAGHISLRQMYLALTMKIPVFQARCRLFYAQSLMQRGRLKPAALIIRDVYAFSKTASAIDNPPEVHLDRICQGLWKRLSYLWTLRRESRLEVHPRRDISQAISNASTGCGRRLYSDINAILRFM
ncbi:hypothetical protein Aperf_G00000022744 [Anoplocephala perfoliata]